MMDVLKLILNFKKKIKNIQYMYDGCFKINVKFKKKFKIFYECMMDVLNFFFQNKKT